jgi:alpha-tubulin suppressor-like RCC1 family protein
MENHMNHKHNILSLGFAAALFAGVLINTSPISVNAYEDFIVDLHDETFIKVEAGENFTVALSSNNEVFTFGRNDRGQLGNGTTDSSLEVFNITESFNLSTGEKVTDIASGWGFTVASTSNNRVFAWGDPQVVQLAKESSSTDPQTTPYDLTSTLNPTNATIRKIDAGDSNIMVWANPNIIRMAGGNNFGQLAQGTTASIAGSRSATAQMDLGGEEVKDVGIFAQTAYVLTESGNVFAWGNNESKQVGNNGASSVTSPAQLTFPGLRLEDNEKVVSVSIGVNHGVAVTSHYKVYFWGTNANAAVGDTLTLPLGTVVNTPIDISEAFVYENEFGDDLSGFATNLDVDLFLEVTLSAYIVRPLEVYALNDATVFFAEEFRQYFDDGAPLPVDTDFIETYFHVIGLNAYNGNNYILYDSFEENIDYLPKLEYANYNVYYYYDDQGDIVDLGFSRTHSIWLNTDGDFTMFGSNEYGEQGLGYTSEEGEQWNYNFSPNVRNFMDNIYAYLPTNLTAPLDDYFNPVGGSTPTLTNEDRAIFGDWNGDNRIAGMVDYLFPDFYFGDIFSDKEWSVITPQQMQFMRDIVATIFEDEILYESYIRTDELILQELNDNDRTAADWIRYDMTYHANYGSYELGWDDGFYLDNETISRLSPSVETRLDRYRELVEAVEAFEDTYLQSFLTQMIALNETTNLSFTYFDDYYMGDSLDLGPEQIEYLINHNYEEDIVAIFEAYDALPEIVQLLINEWNYYGIYEELYYEYHTYFVDIYADELNGFSYDVQEDDWEWYWQLFMNLSEVETLLEGIDALPTISFEWFTSTWEDNSGDLYYDYEAYEYWLFLSELLPYLQEGKPVFDQIVSIEDGIFYDDDRGDYVELESVEAIFAMYADFLALSNEAQDLLDPDYVTWIYSLALEALAHEVESQLWAISDIESNDGVYGLFANLDDVLAALAAFEALPEAALNVLDDDAAEYYAYLLSIKLALQEGLDVYEQIVDIDTYDVDNLTIEQLENISAMYTDYLALSEDAKDLLDPDYVDYLANLAVTYVQNIIDNLPEDVESFEALFNDDTTKQTAIDELLAAWAAYQALSPELKDLVDVDTVAALEAIHARYLELLEPAFDLSLLGLILVHLSAGAYFVIRKHISSMSKVELR